MDRGLDFLTKELRRFGVAVAGIQETKWFGKDVWTSEDCVFLHSGRPLPAEGDPARRNEGVGIWLNKEMSDAWRRGGERWNPVSSRIMSARLMLGARGDKLRSGKRNSDLYLSVLSVYAPTNKATFSVKNKFLNDLQNVIDGVNKNDILVVLGDFNARVGSSENDVSGDCFEREDHQQWGSVLGQYGCGQCNQAGENLLLFCARNQLSIMNTWFRKKLSTRGTWTHPATRQRHLIDYVIMRAGQRVFCRDVGTVRGASFWTDHTMVRSTLVLDCSRPRRTVVSGPKRFATYKLGCIVTFRKYRAQVQQNLVDSETVQEFGSIEDNWSAIKEAVASAADAALGSGRRHQPDWFIDSQSDLEPVIRAKDICHHRLVSEDTTDNRQAFRKAQRVVAKAVKQAKDKWVVSVANEAEDAKKDGRVRWKCIRKLQSAHVGRKPVASSVILDEQGNLIESSDGLCARWGRHFESILNVPSQFNADVIRDMPNHEVWDILDLEPAFEELTSAIRRMKRGTAGGQSGILPELISSGGEPLHRRIHALLLKIWSASDVPSDWRDAQIVPIPKKGDLRSCDNWRGISLLDVVGKIFARIIQDRLEPLAEEVLPESQCGFRRGRGCVDMVFSARQLIEKAIEHESELFVLFVDLRKAYDSVPRSALWMVLEKFGVPPRMVRIIKSLHNGMLASVRVRGGVSESFVVSNGLRQGCALAPMLFNLYFAAVVRHWQSVSSVPGFPLRYRIGRRLVGDRTAKSRLDTAAVTESQYADDAAMYTTSRSFLETMAEEFSNCVSAWGLTINIQKTKAMAVGVNSSRDGIVVPDRGTIETVRSFPYLGSIIADDGMLDRELTSRLAKAARVFGTLADAIFHNSGLSCATRRYVYKVTVLTVLFYGAETWTVKATHKRRLESFHRQCIRSILGISRTQQWEERLTTKELAERFGMPWSMDICLSQHRLRWLGHLARMDDSRLPKRILFAEGVETRPRHGPKKRWRDSAVMDLRSQEIADSEWYALAQERDGWLRLRHQRRPQPAAARDFVCPCGRRFRRQNDISRHRSFCNT